MKLGVVGLGLGYSFCQYLASKGNLVVGIDIDHASKVVNLKRLEAEELPVADFSLSQV
jgi:UDP-N-acetyl-D-mannosaminuronate dehydrogenase